MNCNNKEFYCLTDVEFYTLLCGTGISSWWGFDSTVDFNTLSEDEIINRTLASLYQKGLVDWENKKVKLLSPAYEIFSTLKECTHFLRIKNFYFDTITVYYFSKNNVVSVERCSNETEELLLGIYDTQDFCTEIISEYLPEDIDSSCVYEETSFTLTDNVDRDYMEINDLLTVMEIYSFSTGELTDRLLIQDKGLCYYFYLVNSHMCKKFLNNQDNRNQLISIISAGGIYDNS